MRMVSIWCAAAVLGACGGSPSGPAATPAVENDAAVSDTAVSEPKSSPPQPAARDPKIEKLAKGAFDCKVEDEVFDEECAGYKAWTGEEQLFAEGKGDSTILAMLEDADVKLRLLAAARGFDDAKKFFANKDNGVRLFAVAKKETSPTVGHELGGWVTHVDAQKAGLEKELKAFAKHPVAKFREALAFYLMSRNQSPVAVEVVTILLDDPDTSVRERAIGSLSTGGMTPATEPICKLLVKQLARPDELAASALWAGSSSQCKGMDAQVVAELEKRVSDPTKIGRGGIRYSLAAGGVCGRTQSPELKQKAFEVLRKLSDPKVDSPTRGATLDDFARCDRAGAEKVLSALARDKDKSLAQSAAKELAQLKKK